MEYRFNLFADYFAFHLSDDSPDFRAVETWSPGAVADRLAVVKPHVVAVGTARSMTVPVTVEVRETPPGEHFADWDHVVEASLEVPSGRIVVMGNEYWYNAARIPVRPGTYAVRAYSAGLDTLRNNDLDGDDRYRVVIWPSAHREPAVLKRYAPDRR